MANSIYVDTKLCFFFQFRKKQQQKNKDHAAPNESYQRRILAHRAVMKHNGDTDGDEIQAGQHYAALSSMKYTK